MITYIDTKNREKYQVLFDKAEKALIAASAAGTLPAGIDINTLEIATLNQYFAYLKDLISVSSSEDIKRYFTRLPLDEDFLEIDANTRNIKIPASFSRNGVGVQGDEMAEVVYFTIDRYFDSMDLANDDINIVIQWEAKNANKQTFIGISPNYGKDIETIPGKIIFGWPIYSELTQAAGTVKFAVRFFSLGEADDQGVRALNYSLATLPAEVSIGATLDYDLINKTMMEVDRGKIITGRIKNTGVYDPSIPVPGEPVVSTPLYVIGEDATVRIVDLPGDGSSLELGVSAKPYDIGAILYSWKQWPYDTASGEYSNSPSSLSAVNNGVYEEMTEDLGEDIYYRITSSEGAEPIVYEPIAVADYLENTEYDEDAHGFEKKDGSFVKLYKRLSVASVNQVGIYTVDVGARYGTNVVEKAMDRADGIKIPGPLKPVINLPEPSENVSVTEEDGVTHVIVDNGTAILAANAAAGEEGKDAAEVGEHPQVALAYAWKKVVNGEILPLEGAPVGDMPVAVLPVSQLPTDPAWLENAAENGEPGAKGKFNQQHSMIVQEGNTINIYVDAELKSFESTNAAQGTHAWLALDIDSGEEHLEGVTWEDSYTFEAADENELGVADGHFVFWFKADEGTVTRKVNDTVLTFNVISGAPSDVEYAFNEDNSEMTVMGLPTAELDNTYFVEVTATRNGISTKEMSGGYRLTNSPTKPVLKYRVFENGAFRQVVKDYSTESAAIAINKKARSGAYNKLSFSVEPPALSDNLSYVWMRANVQQEVDEDWDASGAAKLQVDLDNLLPDLFEDLVGDPDIAADGVFGLTTLTELGEVVADADNGPAYQLAEDTPVGFYYCIVINELNNNRTANVSPFFLVSEQQ